MKLKTNQGDEFIVDEDIYEQIKDAGFWTNTFKYKNYTRKYVGIFIDGKKHYLHRYIMGAKKGEEVDHKDNDSLNNVRRNLRKCTRSQNGANRKSTNKTSKYKGVSWCKSHKKWKAQITKNGACKNLGRHENEINAAKVYDKEAIKIHGKFARTNKDLGLL